MLKWCNGIKWEINAYKYACITTSIYIFLSEYIFFVLLIFIENLRNLEKNHDLRLTLYFFVTWHNLYISERLSLCRLKAIKGYLLSHQYFFCPPSPPIFFGSTFYGRTGNPDEDQENLGLLKLVILKKWFYIFPYKE